MVNLGWVCDDGVDDFESDEFEGEGEVIFRQDKDSSTGTDCDSEDSNLIKELAVNTIVHGEYPLPPLEFIDEGSLFGSICMGWKNCGLKAGNRLQRCAWPHIVRGQDCFIVGLNKSGKTLSYLAPICAMLVSDASGWTRLTGKGPVVVIFTHNSYNSIKIEHLAQTLISSSTIDQIQCTAVTEYSAKTYQMCSGGIEILITTPELFLEKADKVEWLKLDRLQFFVLDDAHCTLRTKKELVMSLFTKYENLCRKNSHKDVHPQIIVCGGEWNNDIESVYWSMPRKPAVIIGNIQAAVCYGKIKCKIQYVDPGYKLSTLMNLLDKRTLDPIYNRIIVVCGASSTCKEVYDRIASQENLAVHLCSVDDQEEIKANIKIWEKAPKHECVVFVVKDKIFKHFDVRDANYLIHYDIEDLTPIADVTRKSVFFNRFLCLWDHMRNIAEDDDEEPTEQKKAISDIFMSTDEKDLDRVVRTFVSVGFELPQVVLKQAGQMRRQKESEWPLCQSLKVSGQCEFLKLGTCDTRHIINVDELKKDSTLPKTGMVELRITQCSSVNSFIGQIIRHFPEKKEEEAVSMLKYLEERHSTLKEFFANEENRIPPESLEIGALCAVKIGEDGYTRGKLVQIMTKYQNFLPNIVRVFCIDTGENVMRHAQYELFTLPKELKDVPYLSVEAILVGVKPPFSASEYSTHHLQFMKATVLDKIFKAEICMSLGNTVWISSMKLISDENIVQTVRQQLVQNKYAALNPLHEHWIWTITSRTLDSTSDPFFVKSFYQNDIGYDWAFIPLCNSDEPSVELFSVTQVDTPNGFFGNLAKFVDQLNKLNDDVQVETQKLISIRYKDYADHFISYYSVGKVALVEDDKMWYRCIITEITEGDDYYDEWGELLPKSAYTYFSVFLVDYGEVLRKIPSKSLFPIPTKFVKKLPFQAIYICLIHIVPTGDVWEKECLDYLTEKFQELDSNKTLLVAAYDRSKYHSLYPSYEYNVIAFTANGPYDELGEELVLKKYAEYHIGGERLYMKIKENLPKLTEASESDNDNDEDVWDVSIPGLTSIENSQTKDIAKAVQKDNQVQTSAEKTSKAAVASNVLHPLTRWRQTVDHVFITICLPDIKRYSISVEEDRSLKFICLEPANYEFEVQTFGFMDMEKENQTGQYLQAKFKKQLSGMWPRLTRSDERLLWLKPDYSDVALMLEDNEWKCQQTYFDAPPPDNSDNDSDDEEKKDVCLDHALN